MAERVPTPIVPEWRLIRRERDGQPAHVLLTAEGHFIWCPGKSWELPPGWAWGGDPEPGAAYSRHPDLLIAQAMSKIAEDEPYG
jgi:hypothetical protein